MKKALFYLMGFVILLLIWQCSEKNPIDITAFSPNAPSVQPLFARNNLKLNGSFLPGYESGKIRSDQITLDWETGTDSDFLCYKVFRNNMEVWRKTDQSVSAFTDSNLVQDMYYNYKIAAMNKSGIFKSDTIELKTPQFLPPGNIGFQIMGSNSVKLFWQNRTQSAFNFRIFRKQYLEPDSLYQQVGTASDTFFVDNSVTNQERYYYRITAYNSYESTEQSFPLLVFVNYVMNPPTLVSVQQVPGSRSVRLEWTDNSNAEDGFRIYRRKSTTNFKRIGTVQTDITTYTDNDTTNSLQLDSTYIYSVKAFNSTDSTAYSNAMSITISQPQAYREIGTGSVNWDFPFHTFYHDARTQTIYLDSELGGSFTIRKIAFNIIQVPGQMMNNFTIRMKHTNLASYSNTTFDNSGYTVCLTTNLNITPTGWVEIPLSTPFYYDGTRNLIIDISFDNGSYTTSGYSTATNTSNNRSLYNYTDSGMGDPLTWSNGIVIARIPNIRLYSSY